MGPRQVRDRADRVGDLALADERDRVHGDPLAAQVVPVRLGHRAELHLRDLRPAADDDDALAEDLAQRRPGLRPGDARQLRRSAAARALPRPRVSKSKTRVTSGSWHVAANVLIATISAPAPWSTAMSCPRSASSRARTLTAPRGVPCSGSCRSGRSSGVAGGLLVIATHYRQPRVQATERNTGGEVGVSVLRVAVVGSTGYGGGELVRLLARHPFARIEALAARGRDDEPVGASHPHLAGTGFRIWTSCPGISMSASRTGPPPTWSRSSRSASWSSTSGRTSACATRRTIRAGTGSIIPGRICSTRRSTGCRSSIGRSWRSSGVAASSPRRAATPRPRCWPSPRSPGPA